MKLTNFIKSSAICLYLVLLSVIVRGQDIPAFIEITDTIETAYDIYYGGWEQNGFNFTRKEIKDSVGIDSVRITRIYYYEEFMDKTSETYTVILGDTVKIMGYTPMSYKVYLDFELKEYLGVRKGSDNRFSGYGYVY